MAVSSAPAIVVLNKKYFPRDCLAAAQVGATSFTLSVLQILYQAGILCGVVLYQRVEELEEACCDIEPFLYHDLPVATVSFNFRIAQPSVAFTDAYVAIARKTQQDQMPFIYYQTDTMLHYHPEGIRFCVTHHGPFVSDFAESFSPELAQLAFGGDPSKVKILEEQQRLGIERLLRDNYGTVLAHSALQQRFLQQQGLHGTRFQRLRPPIGVPHFGNCLPRDVSDFVSAAEILLFTAVARLDYFKNVDLVIQAGLEVLKRGLAARILVVGDTDNDDSRRRCLLNMVPEDQRDNFLIISRLCKDQLYSLFYAARDKGIFICTSRYETLGITPLEAAASGVTTLITDSLKVEASNYFPPSCRVASDSMKIAAKVQCIYHQGVLSWAQMVRDHVRPETSFRAFRQDLLRAWRSMSSSTGASF